MTTPLDATAADRDPARFDTVDPTGLRIAESAELLREHGAIA
jgi:hypothetical protein